VRPSLPISNYLTWVSGVTPGKLANAPPYSQVKDKIQALLQGATVIGHTL
jgi:RNA exonuclease 4